MPSNIEIIKQKLDSIKAFDSGFNSTALRLTKIVDEDIPLSMSLAIANYTMSMFVGHFHWKIKLSEDNIVPANAIFFILAKSGAKKTSTVITMEKSISKGLEIINRKRWEKAKEFADMHDADLIPPLSLDSGISTEQGLFQKLNWFEQDGIGMPSLYVDEISTELASNADIVPNIKIVSQLFDNGEMKAKTLKDTKQQLRDIKCMGMNAMFIGSEHGILEDESVLRKFLAEVVSKLGRRVHLCYPRFDFEEKDFNNWDDILNDADKLTSEQRKVKEQINKSSEELASEWIDMETHHLEMTEDTRVLNIAYAKYCKHLASTIEVEAVNLEQQHRHWKTLKLACVYALFNKHDKIEVNDLREAIAISEMNGSDLRLFLEKANRETYEIMSDHMEQSNEPMSVHDMVKQGWAKTETAVKNMIILANSKQKDRGHFDIDDGLVEYIRFEKTEGIGASFKNMAGLKTKDERNAKCFDGFSYKRNEFTKMELLLRQDTAYCPFEFREGKRGKDFIISGADFVVLDVDDSDITSNEAHDMLMDYNHMIANTSSNNPYKFRVLIPTDVTVSVSNDKWKPFMAKVKEQLGIEIDLLPKSQIYYGYEGREVLVNLNGYDLEASELVKNIEVEIVKIKQVRGKQLDSIWDNRLQKFRQAYECSSGKGLHSAFFGAMKDAYRHGFSIEMTIELIADIKDYNDDSNMVRDSFWNSLTSQMERMYGLE